ncbi:hypothetical protein PWEIH_12580 [Listeria weihenstephanensis FSL R9-0317]|uniref:Uncharacterized protein n=1 Tax=Listeria weihenstephanensis TaxID=1006155 RepID=A0A1S7FRT2_9LIST|nr:hypothetical protein UE46_03070 [Listeria weihenstephanensis]EUJ36630.1 hypothetical protein PWEIH_12580 [Listeria weihenstephanensis FSL R9-0317]
MKKGPRKKGPIINVGVENNLPQHFFVLISRQKKYTVISTSFKIEVTKPNPKEGYYYIQKILTL